MNHRFYIGGYWVDPAVCAALDFIDPSTEQPFTKVSLGSKADVDRAVAAARAYPGWDVRAPLRRLQAISTLTTISS